MTKEERMLWGGGFRLTVGAYVGVDGQPVRKTPVSHPYSYDPFIVWQGKGEATASVYTDRLLQWDWDKHNELCRKHFGDEGQYWRSRQPAKVEAFMRDWTDDPQLTLVRIIEYCNASSGYPCWRLDFYTVAGQPGVGT